MRGIKSGLTVAIAGTGGFASVHAGVWAMLKGVRVKAVLGRDPVRTAAFADRHGIQGRFTDPDEFIRHEGGGGGGDILDVVTVPCTHIDTARKLMGAFRGVMVEKPLDVDVEKAVSFYDEVKAKGLSVGVVSQLKYGRLFKRMKALLSEGALGELDHFSVNICTLREAGYYGDRPWRDDPRLSGGGVLVSQAIHRLNFLFSLTGYGVQSVYAIKGPGRYAKAVEEAVTVAVMMSGGVTGSVHATTLCPSAVDRIELEGTKGAVAVDLSSGVITTSPDGPGDAARTERMDPEDENLLRNQFEDFARMAADGRGECQNLVQSVNDMIIIDAIYRSVSSGRPARVNGLLAES